MQLVEEAGMKVLEIKDADTGEAIRPESERIYVVAGQCGAKKMIEE
jgi:hypothetical protein